MLEHLEVDIWVPSCTFLLIPDISCCNISFIFSFQLGLYKVLVPMNSEIFAYHVGESVSHWSTLRMRWVCIGHRLAYYSSSNILESYLNDRIEILTKTPVSSEYLRQSISHLFLSYYPYLTILVNIDKTAWPLIARAFWFLKRFFHFDWN